MEGLKFLSDTTSANIAEQAQQAGLTTFKYVMGLLEPFKFYIIAFIIAVGLLFIVKRIIFKLIIIAGIILFAFAFCTQPRFLGKEKLQFSNTLNSDLRSVTNGISNLFNQ